MPHLTERLYALCIGINHCPTSARLANRPLEYAEKDATALYELLCRIGLSIERGVLLTGKQATLQTINETLRELLLNRARRNDLVLFYFAGHSLPLLIQDEDEETEHSEVFLASYDLNEQRIQQDRGFRLDEALGLERLREDFFVRTRSHKVLFLFDSCYSGDFFGPSYRTDADPIQGHIQQVFGRTTAGARIALSSCLPTQQAREDKRFEHGLFTYYLLQALKGNAGSAQRPDGSVTVGSLFEYLCEALPLEQRPVRSGVEQDAFRLVSFPPRNTAFPTHLGDRSLARHEPEREQWLQMLCANHQGFLSDRLASFVGRTHDLEELRQRILERLRTGGYITITGQAGQGKSSVIAKLVEEHNPNTVAYHFIPFRPGPDHQVGLLRNLMARLLLKYNLPDWYIASESRAALRDLFPKVLEQIVKKGGQEIIFIDGLDQLEEDLNGTRDLSFLPTNPAPGIVFVLGTRPDDTLKPLTLLKPHDEYRLPDLSRRDFDLILIHRQARLGTAIADQLYHVMQGNALYLDLVAQELSKDSAISPEIILTRIAHNPDNLFTLALSRLRQSHQTWHEEIKPILGVLLTTMEPLLAVQIRQIIQVDDEQTRTGLVRLGGLLVRDGEGRYSLFHRKLSEYLRQGPGQAHDDYVFSSDEEEQWHSKIADWCEQGDISCLWLDTSEALSEQAGREYARKHYITHLYHSHNWPRLFAAFDTGAYGRGKHQYDPSMLAYVHDLDLGRQATVRPDPTFEEKITLLPRLWRYSMLRCSLASQANAYPIDAFQLLLRLDREHEAFGLAEMQDDPRKKAKVFDLIGKHLLVQPGRFAEGLQFLERTCDFAHAIDERAQRGEMLCQIGVDFVHAGLSQKAESLWEEAVVIAHDGLTEHARDDILLAFAQALIDTRQWDRAEQIIRALPFSYQYMGGCPRATGLVNLGTALAQNSETMKARNLLAEVEQQADSASRLIRDEIFGKLGRAFIQVGYLSHTEAVIRKIEDRTTMAEMLGILASALVQADQRMHAERLWQEISDYIEQAERTGKLNTTFLWSTLALSFTQAHEWVRAREVLEFIPRTRIDGGPGRCEILAQLGLATLEESDVIQAEAILEEIRVEARPDPADDHAWDEALKDLSVALARSSKWAESEQVARLITDTESFATALTVLGDQFAREGKHQRAESLWQEAEVSVFANEEVMVGDDLIQALINAEEWERARRIMNRRLLSMGATALISAKQWKQLNLLMRSINPKRDICYDFRANDLSKLALAMTRAEQDSLAEKLWQKIDAALPAIIEEQRRYEAEEAGRPRLPFSLLELATNLIDASQWERADKVIHELKPDQRAIALARMGEALLSEEELKHRPVGKYLAAQLAAVRRLWNMDQRNLLRAHISWDRLQNPLWRRRLGIELLQRGRKIAYKVKDPESRAYCLTELGQCFKRADLDEQAQVLWKDAMDGAYAIQRDEEKALAMVYLVKTVKNLETKGVSAATWEAAEELVYAVQREDDKADCLIHLGKGLAEAGMLERAIKVWIDAKKVIQEIDMSRLGHMHSPEEILYELGTTLVRFGYLNEAEAVANEINDNPSRRFFYNKADVLLRIADIHAEDHDYESLLRLTQRSLLTAKDRVTCLLELELICKLLPLEPEIGIELWNAFDWVASFFV